MYQPQLPPECILIIIDFVHNNDDMKTMASLLCVNKTICAFTLTFLYKDCFSRLMRDSYRHLIHNAPQLVRTLLRQVHPQITIPDILKVAFLSPDKRTDLGSTAPPPPPVFKYGRFISTIHIVFEFISFMFESICDKSPLMDYAATNQLYEKYKDAGYIGNNTYNIGEDKVLREALMSDICHQLTWTLCQDHPESINSLTIPLKDIQRYIDHVHLFTSLSSVKFSIIATGCDRWDSYLSDPTRGIKETERDRFFKGMMEFVRQHTSIHKNVLQNVEVPYSSLLYRTGQYSIPDVYYAIQSLLPSFQNLRSITTGRIELLARPAGTCLSRLESITVLPCSGNLKAEEISELLSRHPPFLSRYRSLKHLTSATLGPDMFQWAVLEKKKQKDAAHQQESIVGRHLSSWQHGHHISNLVPLQSISISSMKPSPMIQELNDIAFAFSDSLEEWSVRNGPSGHRYVKNIIKSPVVTNGQGWDLPRLRVLSFEVLDSRLHFDMDGLERCRALESLTLHDNLVTHRPQDIHTWSVVCLPHLKKLDLKGSPARHFNMDSLRQSPCLEELTMKTTPLDVIDYCIPPFERLGHGDSDPEGLDDHGSSGMSGSSQAYRPIRRRPLYTWDWYLPNLRKLDLATVFALMLDFQWLQDLPNLQSLRLDISSPVERPCRRHIKLKDLLRREPQQAPDESGSGEIFSDRYISSPKLESIVFDGNWIFGEKFMETLCLTVAPNLSSFGYEGSHADFSLRECIAVSRKMPRLKNVRLRRLPLGGKPYGQGLVQREWLWDVNPEECVVFNISVYEYYLLPSSESD